MPDDALRSAAATGRASEDLGDDVAMMVETVRDFAATAVAPGVVERDREERLDPDLVREIGKLDLIGGVVPREYGGAALSRVAFTAIVEEMSRTDHLVALTMTFPSGLAGSGLLKFGTPEQCEQFLPPLCAGEIVASAAITEPSSGTNVTNMHTICRRDGDDYIIDGQKSWIGFIADCEWMIAFATFQRGGGREKVCAFVIPADTPGVTVHPFKNKLGFRGVSTGEVSFDGVRVPRDFLIGEEGQGLDVAMAAVETGRLGVASRALGLAQDCLDRSVAYALEREVFKRPIAQYQLVQSMITDMVVGIEGARAMVRSLAEERDAGGRARGEASLAKMHASDVAMMCATHAVQIHGAYGTHEEYHVARHFRDAKVFQIIEGQNQLHRTMVAEYALGYRKPERD